MAPQKPWFPNHLSAEHFLWKTIPRLELRRQELHTEQFCDYGTDI